MDIVGESTDGGSYWDKVATQVAANDMPDVIQMDEKDISECGKRGALMDLSSINTADFAEGTVELGKVGEKLVGINIGVNAPALVANPKVFADAGVLAATGARDTRRTLPTRRTGERARPRSSRGPGPCR